MKNIVDLIKETLVEALVIKPIGKKGSTYHITINGNEYGYQPINMSIADLDKKFRKMLGFSAGKALAWLKRNTELISGSKQKVQEIYDAYSIK